MIDNVIDKVINKVRKLLALANDVAASEGERDNALRQAHKMLTLHNLAMEDVPAEAQEKREQHVVTLSVYPWARNLAHSMGMLFYCHYSFSGAKGKRASHYFIGKQSNAITAAAMAAYMVSSVFREMRQRYASETSPAARSFAVGVSDRLRERVKAVHKQTQEECAVERPGSALVLLNFAAAELRANRAWLDAAGVKLRLPPDRTKGVALAAYVDGQAYGSAVSLNRQVTNKTPDRLRLT
jgi:hypothetical protein